MMLGQEELKTIRSGAAYYEGEAQSWIKILTELLTCLSADGHTPKEVVNGEKSRSYPGILMRSLRGFAVSVHQKQDWKLYLSSELLSQLYCDYLEQLCEISGMVMMEYFFSEGGELSDLERDSYVPLMVKYPVWIRRVVERTVSYISFIEEMLSRLRADKSDDTLMKLHSAGADSHNYGRRVLFLELYSGKKILYKPHPLDTDEGWRNICRWILRHTGIEIPYIQSENHGGYGYAPYLSYKNPTQEEYTEFFRHAGMLLCVVYWLEGTDMHYENVIAHGKWPYLVDLELVTGEKENFTVADTAMLHFPKYRDGRLIDDFGAFTNTNPQWNHLPREDGKVVTASQYPEALLGGFEELYHLLADCRREEAGNCLSCSPRYVLRPTSYYTALLRRLNMPDTLADGQVFYKVARESLMTGGGSIASPILQSELDAALRNDIPIFYHGVGTKDLHNEDGVVISAYFKGRPGEVLGRDFSKEDLEKQIALIRSGLTPAEEGEIAYEHET